MHTILSQPTSRNLRWPTFLAIALMVLVSVSCSRTRDRAPEINPEFGNYISAFTSGVISRESAVRIRLAADYPEPVEPGQEVDSRLFAFTPSLKGAAHWVDSRTIEFTPENPMPSGQVFDVFFYVKSLFNGVPEELGEFSFQFKTIDQGFNVHIDGLEPYETEHIEWQHLTGKLVTFDLADSTQIKRVLTAKQGNARLKVKWLAGDGRSHAFRIDSIARGEKASSVVINWNGKPIGVSEKDKQSVEVPALGDFKITSVRVVQTPEQFVRIHFSDPIKAKQNFDGILFLRGEGESTYVVEGNTVTLHPPNRLSGTRTLVVNTGLKNFKGYKMAEGEERELVFEEMKPEVRMVGNGAILPNSHGLVFPFEAVGLSAVDFYVKEVFENNITQFLQVNNITGNYQMNRVARTILKKKVDLNKEGGKDLHTWNRFSVDLNELMDVRSGAIYQVEIRYNKDYAVYSECSNNDQSEAGMQTLLASNDADGWQDTRNEYDDYWNYNDYNYNERRNPCHNTYYYHKRVQRNILASDLGIIAKAGGDRVVHVMINDLLTTKPMSNTKVEFFNYQQQLIKAVETNREGMAEVELRQKPWLMVATNGDQRGYLKMDDGLANSLSKFDVAGASTQKGVKGFVYGERGVWRPGDSIYLSFMLQDPENLIPDHHPVNLELVDPRGSVVHTAVNNRPVNGLYDFRMATDQEANTGNYRARIKVGNRTFHKTLKVETVKPNRLKIYMDFGKKMIPANEEEANAKLRVKWLHGAVASNLKAKVDVTVNQIRTGFPGFKGYVFDDPIRSFYADQETVFEEEVDENGEASFHPDISVGDAAPGMLKAYFTTKVFEKGGGFSIDRNSVNYSPYTHYVGVKVPKGNMYRGTLVTDKEHTIEVATVTEHGKKVSRKGLKVQVYHLQWRWWWDRYDDDIANYIARTSTVPELEKTINTVNGKGSFKMNIERPKYGRFLVRVTDPESGHSTGKVVYLDWPYWARSNRTNNEFATMLSFSSDKERYDVGENVKVSFPSSTNGRALVTLENGTKVLKKFWVETTKGETRFEFPTTPDMAPNAYVHVSLLQPHKATANDLPIRLYGVIPILVEDPNTHLEPEIQMANVLRPETTTTIKVKEKNGRKMTYTLAVVDEGLLDLTRFKTPDPWNHFYAREALGVKTWDIYDMVMGAYGGELDKMLSLGGDGEGSGKKSQKANRFKPMVRFLGPFELNAGKTAAHKVKIPNYVGSVRVMVVAGEDKAYGRTEKAVPVRKPLMVLGTLPRVLGPGETVLLPVNVFAMEKQVKNVKVEVQANGLFKMNGGNTRTLTFNKIGDEVVNFELEVAKELGIGKVKIIATSGNERAVDEIELDVRTPNPEVTDVLETVLEPGQTWDQAFSFDGIKGTVNGVLEVTSVPPLDLDRRLKYLIRYPHGCIEQTTSGAFPQLFLSNVMQLNSNYRAEIDKNMVAALKRLTLFQTNEGGFAYWPGQSDDNEWGSNYAGHYIIEAEKAGYKLPKGMKKDWISFQSKMARNWSPDKDFSYGYHYTPSNYLNQAYRLFTLALANAPELGAMNRLREIDDLPLTTRWRLAAAYQLAGQPEVARSMVDNLGVEIEDYTELTATFGSSARDKGMILEALSLMDRKAQSAVMAKEVAGLLTDKQWMSTQTTAYCLIGMARWLGSTQTTSNLKFDYQIGGGKSVSKNTHVAIFSDQLDSRLVAEGSNLKLTNNGKNMLYARLMLEGVPVTGDQSSAASNLKVEVSYTDMDGGEIDPTRIVQGTDFIAEVRVHNPGTRGHLYQMALNQVFPSGWEIHNARMDENVSAVKNDHFTYRDIKDDRVYTYYRLRRGETKTYRVQLNATYMGRYYLPTVMSEAMYDHTINAREPGQWVEVVSPGVL